MMELLKKGVKFVWDDKCEEAFHTLRAQLTIAPVLAQPDNTKPFDVYCDASGTAWMRSYAKQPGDCLYITNTSDS